MAPEHTNGVSGAQQCERLPAIERFQSELRCTTVESHSLEKALFAAVDVVREVQRPSPIGPMGVWSVDVGHVDREGRSIWQISIFHRPVGAD
jgi:hypothetical protein